MNRHGSLLVVVAKLAISVVVIAVLLAAIAQTVQRPVSGGTKQFSSEFVDANGLIYFSRACQMRPALTMTDRKRIITHDNNSLRCAGRRRRRQWP